MVSTILSPSQQQQQSPASDSPLGKLLLNTATSNTTSTSSKCSGLSGSFNDDHMQWWQKSAVRRTVKFLEKDMMQVVAESPFLRQQQVEDHKIPVFHRSEIITGKLLGRGGFSNVYEIVEIRLNQHASQRVTVAQQQLRQQIAQQVQEGTARLAIKQLQERLVRRNVREFQLAAADLVVEASYMSACDHPNIVSIRGLPLDGVRAFEDGSFDAYFIVCDQLQETLDKRIETWKQQQQSQEEPDLMQKTTYALQLASALEYLHERRIIFRDLKPQNIGFTWDDQIQLLDFGLCRELPERRYSDSVYEMYEMSGVGTRRYMAPEIINDSRYNLKADVYSWSMVFWEILTHTKPYALHSIEDHRITVCQGGERPRMRTLVWPTSIQDVLSQSWKESVRQRPTMKQVCERLQETVDQCAQDKENKAAAAAAAKAAANVTPDSPRGVVPDDILELHDDSQNMSNSSSSSFHLVLPATRSRSCNLMPSESVGLFDAGLLDNGLFDTDNSHHDYHELTIECEDGGIEVLLPSTFFERKDGPIQLPFRRSCYHPRIASA